MAIVPALTIGNTVGSEMEPKLFHSGLFCWAEMDILIPQDSYIHHFHTTKLSELFGKVGEQECNLGLLTNLAKT